MELHQEPMEEDSLPCEFSEEDLDRIRLFVNHNDYKDLLRAFKAVDSDFKNKNRMTYKNLDQQDVETGWVSVTLSYQPHPSFFASAEWIRQSAEITRLAQTARLMGEVSDKEELKENQWRRANILFQTNCSRKRLLELLKEKIPELPSFLPQNGDFEFDLEEPYCILEELPALDVEGEKLGEHTKERTFLLALGYDLI